MKAPTINAPVKIAPIWPSLMWNVSMIGVVSGPISSLSDWCNSMKTKNVPKTNQR